MRYLLIIALTALSTASEAQTTDNIQTLQPGMYQTRRGTSCGYPHRAPANLYNIDGVQVQNISEEATVPPSPVEPEKPLIELNPNTLRFTRAEINAIPTVSICDIVSLAPTVYQRQRGADVNMNGSHAADVLYVIDGMRIARN